MSARWTSRNVVRLTMRCSPSSSTSGQHAPEVARGLEQLADLVALLLRGRRGRRHAFSASPSTPIVSGCRVQSSGVAIERYWWMRAKRHRLRERLAARRRARLERRLAVGDPVRVAGEHRAQLRPRRARRSAPCAARSGASSAAGRTGSRRRRATCSGETRWKRLSRSIGLQTEVSKKTPALPPKRPPRPAEVGDPGVGDDQLRVRDSASTRRREVVGDRRQPAAAVDQDRHARARRRARRPARAARRSAGSSAPAGGA